MGRAILAFFLAASLASPAHGQGFFGRGSATLSSGSASGPSLRCPDTDTGFYCPAANVFSTSTNGVERLRLGADGSVILTDGGTLNADIPASKLVLIADNSSFEHIMMVSTGANTNPIQFNFAKTRSTGNTGDANVIVANGDGIGALNFYAADGVDYIESARILVSVDAAPGVGDMGGRFVFSTTADGASAATERMRITQAGDVVIGADISPDARLEIVSAGAVETYAVRVSSANGTTDLWALRSNTGNAGIASQVCIAAATLRTTTPPDHSATQVNTVYSCGFDLFSSTGTAVGAWRNMRTGAEP